MRYRQIPLWFNRDELAASISDLHGAMLPRLDNKPGPDRGFYLLSPILFPTEELPEHRVDHAETQVGHLP